MSDLPENWSSANILELSRIIRGVTYSKNDAHDEPGKALIPVLRAMNITERGLVFDDLVYVPRKLVKNEQVIKAGDVVAAISSGSITVVGKAKQTRSDLDAAFGAFCAVLRPVAGIDPNYFGHFFGTQHYRFTVSSLARGVNINNLKREHFAQIEIPLAPLNEQKRIADKLDTLLARVDSCQTHLERVPQILKRFRQSVLAAATSGRLTEEWREANGHRGLENWENKTLGSLVVESANGFSKRRSDVGQETVVLRLADFKNAERFIGNERTIKMDEKELRKYCLIDGDLLIVRVNGSRDLAGRFIEYKNPSDTTEAYCDHFIRLRLDKKQILSKFASYVGNSGAGRNYLELELITSAGQNTINQPSVFGLEIDLPPIAEQYEIVRRVERLFAVAERLETRWKSAQGQVASLTPSLLAKAFRGELVSQEQG